MHRDSFIKTLTIFYTLITNYINASGYMPSEGELKRMAGMALDHAIASGQARLGQAKRELVIAALVKEYYNTRL